MNPKKDRKNNPIDKFIFGLIDNHLDMIALGILIIMAVIVRIVLMSEVKLSPDYESYYLKWVMEYKERGIIAGLSTTIGDYYVPLNIMYALCSLFPCEPYIPLTIFSGIAEFISAFYLYRIAEILLLESGKDTEKAKKVAAYIAVATLYLPFVVFNGSLWKQCDAIYAVFLVIAIFYLLKDEYNKSFIFLALSFGFKLQSIFFVPLYLVIYMAKKNFSILKFVWVPVMYLVMGLPSVILGRGLRATYFSYLAQTNETSSEGYGMVSFYPNFYNYGLDNYDEFLKVPGIALTAAILVILAVFTIKHKSFLGNRANTLYLGVFLGWTCCMFLPGMHERYDYVIVLLATILFATAFKRNIWAAVVMNLCSFLVYAIVLFRSDEISMIVVSCLEIAAYIYLSADFIRRVSEYDA